MPNTESEERNSAEEAELEAELLDLFSQLERFLLNPALRNRHLVTKHVEIYVRRSFRRVGLALDLADITVAEEWQGKGIFRRFMEQMGKVNPHPILIVADVISPWIENYLRKRPEWQQYDIRTYYRICQ